MRKKEKVMKKIELLEREITKLSSSLRVAIDEKELLSLKLHNSIKELIEIQKLYKESKQEFDVLKQEFEEFKQIKSTENNNSSITKDYELAKDKILKLEEEITLMRQISNPTKEDIISQQKKDSLENLNQSLSTLSQLLNSTFISIGNCKSQISKFVDQ